MNRARGGGFLLNRGVPGDHPPGKLSATVFLVLFLGLGPPMADAAVGVFGCEGPLGFDRCHLTGRGELQCRAVNQTAELVIPQPGDQFLAWAYDAAGALLSSDGGNYAYPGQIVAGDSGLVTFPLAPGTTRVVLCMTDPADIAGGAGPSLVTAEAARCADWVLVAGLIPVSLGGGLALYLTLYGVVTGRFPSFKRRKFLQRLLRIKRGRDVAESMAENWVLREEAPVEFWLSVVAGLLTALPLLAFSIPLLLEELW